MRVSWLEFRNTVPIKREYASYRQSDNRNEEGQDYCVQNTELKDDRSTECSLLEAKDG